MTPAERGELASLMRRAWAAARDGASRWGGTSRQYLAEALRQVWAQRGSAAAERSAMRERVLATAQRIRRGLPDPPSFHAQRPAPLPVARHRLPSGRARAAVRV